MGFFYEDKVKIYSVFGGVLYYNRFIDDNISVEENLKKEIEPVLYKIGKYYYDDPKNRVNGEFDVVTLNRNVN